jgi:hypothetical protein
VAFFYLSMFAFVGLLAIILVFFENGFLFVASVDFFLDLGSS